MSYASKIRVAAGKSNAGNKDWILLPTGAVIPVERIAKFLPARAQRLDRCRERSVETPNSFVSTCNDPRGTERSEDALPALALPTPDVEEGKLLLTIRILSLKRESGWAGKGSKGISQAACIAAITFIEAARSATKDLSLPRVGPSVLGGVALQWDFGPVHFMARIDSDLRRIHIQEEGPGFRQTHGVTAGEDAIERLRDLAAK
jgi:hypothetical protein